MKMGNKMDANAIKCSKQFICPLDKKRIYPNKGKLAGLSLLEVNIISMLKLWFKQYESVQIVFLELLLFWFF